MKTVHGLGMPIHNNDPLSAIKKDFDRGNLILRFNVEFPRNLNEGKKEKLTAIFDAIEGL